MKHQPALLYITVTPTIKKGDRPNKVTKSTMVIGSQPQPTKWAAAPEVHLVGGLGALPQEILKSNTSNGGILGLFRTKLTMKHEHIFRYLTMQNLQYAFVGGSKERRRERADTRWTAYGVAVD